MSAFEGKADILNESGAILRSSYYRFRLTVSVRAIHRD
jgi:hypothetical protein